MTLRELGSLIQQWLEQAGISTFEWFRDGYCKLTFGWSCQADFDWLDFTLGQTALFVLMVFLLPFIIFGEAEKTRIARIAEAKDSEHKDK